MSVRFFAGLVLSLTVSLHGETPPLLQAAVDNYAAGVGRWAYTQTEVRTEDGAITRVRHDPSQPPDRQWTLLEKDGRPATEREKSAYSKSRQSRSKSRRSVGDLLELDRATVATETDTTVRFNVPLRATGNDRFPPERFEAIVQVDKARAALDKVDVRVRQAFRVALVAKVKAGELEVNLTTVDPAHPPVVTRIRGGGSGSVLFVKIDKQFDYTRGDYAWVKPYDERFHVEFGEAKALDF